MSFKPIDDRQVVNRAALTHIGSAANSTLDVIFSDLDTIVSTILTNPMTTLGDTIYGGSSPAGTPTRLAGDTSNARKFLNSTASSGVATAPDWSFSRSYSNKTGSYTLAISDDSVVFNISTASNATLPTAVSVTNQEYYIKNYQQSTALLTILTTSSQTIDGRASGTVILSPGDSLHVVSDGTNWQAIEIEESVNARYTWQSNENLNGTPALIPWDTKTWDTHSGMSGGVYTSKVAGKYEVTAKINSGTFTGAGGSLVLYLYLNGSVYSELNRYVATNGQTSVWQMMGTDNVQCNAGDTISIYALDDNSTDGWGGNTLQNYITITKIGN